MAPEHADHLCPTCKRHIINRKIERCLYCGATLPAALLFTQEQIAAIEVQEGKRRIASPNIGSSSGTGFDFDFGFGDAAGGGSDGGSDGGD